MKTFALSLSTTLLGLALTATGTGQMMKRQLNRYDPALFNRCAPALGTQAPELKLQDIYGTPWSLSQLRGRRLVLIGGGYT